MKANPRRHQEILREIVVYALAKLPKEKTRIKLERQLRYRCGKGCTCVSTVKAELR